jgi:16S rRNA (uracil1498-N3)-methyltransferase
MRRFYVAPGALDGDSVSIDSPLAQRLAAVLRLKAGERIVLFDGGGNDATVRLTSVSARLVAGDIESRTPGPPESRTRVHLYQSITKGERFEWLVEKATEIGVASITPLLTARAVVKTAAGGARAERWRRIAVEAAEQCGRGVVPGVGAPLRLEDALASATGVMLLPYEDADHTAASVAGVLHERVDDVFASSSVSIFIGPEGGYEPAEVEHACAADAAVVTLGDRVLRSETAGLVALTLVMQAIGELG